jgi:hypothetical protein
MARILPLALASRSEAYELVTRKGASSRIAHDKIDDRYISNDIHQNRSRAAQSSASAGHRLIATDTSLLWPDFAGSPR